MNVIYKKVIIYTLEAILILKFQMGKPAFDISGLKQLIKMHNIYPSVEANIELDEVRISEG